MPVPALASLARKTGKPFRKVERYWEEAKKQARKQGVYKKDGEQRYWSYVMGIVKRRTRPADGNKSA